MACYYLANVNLLPSLVCHDKLDNVAVASYCYWISYYALAFYYVFISIPIIDRKTTPSDKQYLLIDSVFLGFRIP